MSTTSEITRLINARNTIRDKLINLGLANSNTKLDALASAVDGIANNGAISATVQEGTSYTIPAGYHNGSGTVTGEPGGGNYTLQSKTITPTKSQQNVTSDEGYYGLSGVTVNAIPDAYQNVSAVTASAPDILATKIIVDSVGNIVTGNMTNVGAVSKTLDAISGNQSYTVPSGYHNGSGTVNIVLEEKSATPSASAQDITPTNGKVLSKVTVTAIPSNYQDVSGVTATPPKVLYGYKFATASGLETGTMVNRGIIAETVSAAQPTFTIPDGYHNGSGTVSVILEEKDAVPSGAVQTIVPTSGKVLSKVVVAAIPSKYGDTTSDDAVASQLLYGKYAHTFSNGAAIQIQGTMVDNGTINASFDGLTSTSYTVPSGYTSGGVVSLTNDIEIALASI